MADEAFVNGGFGFQWHITGRCAGKCRHCYQSGISGEELPVDALKHIADCIISAVPAPVTINVTGGEPLMYQYHGQSRGVFELMLYLSSFAAVGELNIITGTRGMDQSMIRCLKELPKLSYVKVSLESHDPLIDDQIRGLGHNKMARENIAGMVDAGLRVIIMSTLSKINYKSVAGLCSLAEDLGTHGVIFERFVPLGQGAVNMNDDVLAPEEWQEVLEAIYHKTLVTPDELRSFKAFWVNGDYLSGAPCCLGPGAMAMMPDGTVYPCRRVPEAVGKLPDDGMPEILRRLGAYSSVSQKCFDFGF